MISTPGYPNRFVNNVNQPDWKALAFNPGRPLQSAELNELQSVLTYSIECLADSFYKNGAWMFGGDVTAVPGETSGLSVNVSAGRLYAYGYFHDIPANGTSGLPIGITGVGTETISLVLTTDFTTYATDSTLSDPVVGAEAYGKPGADRLHFLYSYVLNDANGVLIATFIDGVLQNPPDTNNLIDQFLALMAQRTYETSGNFIAVEPDLAINDVANSSAQMMLTITGGVAYPMGVRVTNTKKDLFVLRPVTGKQRLVEPNTYLSGVKVYTLDDAPVVSVDAVQANIPLAPFTLVRGTTVNGPDGIPSQYQPVQSIVSITTGTGGSLHTYIQGTDYALAGNNISWLPGGTAPGAGASYAVTVIQTTLLTKAIRVQTVVTGETHTVPSSGTTTLGHTDLDFSTHTVVTNTTTSTTLAYGVDYTINRATGVLTYINRPATGNTLSINYQYWAHSTEGDCLGNDSFQDSAGDILLNDAPKTTPSGTTIDYRTQIAFDTTSGRVPVTNSPMYFSYTYALGRIDTLAWHYQNGLEVLPGVPGISPTPPSPSPAFVPIADIILPPLATKATTSFRPYNNVTMYETELRVMQNQVLNLMEDVAQFQLAQNAQNTATPSDKIGIFADNLKTPFGADTGNMLFNGTFDFPAATFSLPRTQGSLTPLINPVGADTAPSVNAVLKNDIWMINYTEIDVIQQPYASQASVINLYGAVNQNAQIVLSPSADVEISETLTINGASQSLVVNASGVANPLLLANMIVGNSALGAVNIPTGYTGEFVGTDTNYANYATMSGLTWAVGSNLVWGDIIANTIVSVGSTPVSKVITVTGSGFRSSDRAICLTFDGIPLALTPTGSTVAESSGLYPGSVVANSAGNWTATFTVPAGIATGPHNVQVVSHTFADITAVSSYATSIYSASAYQSEFDVNVTNFIYEVNQGQVATCYIPVYNLCGVTNVGPPTAAMLAAVNGPIAYLIATIISEAYRQGTPFTASSLLGGLDYMYAATNVYVSYLSVRSTILAYLNELNYSSSNISANAQILLSSGYPILATSLCSIATGATDPLAQTFTLSEDKEVSGYDIYFAVAPSSGQQVGVALTTVVNGVPTKDYMAQAYLPSTSCIANPTRPTTPTSFTFSKPVFLTGGTEYAFVVLTQDTLASIWTASLGKTDVNGNGLIAKNPSSGTMLQSSNASSWLPLLGQDMMFNVRACNFATPTATLNLGQITFGFASCLFAFLMPYSIPNEGCSVVFQYSVNGTEWLDFSPMVEINLDNALTNIYLRILLTGTNSISPTIGNTSQLLNYIYLPNGCYIHPEVELPASTSGATHVSFRLNTMIPGSTALAFYASFDHGTTWILASEVTGDATELVNLGNNSIWSRHYIVPSPGGAAEYSILTKCLLSSTLNYASPVIAAYTWIAY